MHMPLVLVDGCLVVLCSLVVWSLAVDMVVGWLVVSPVDISSKNVPIKEYFEKKLYVISKQPEAELQARDQEILELKARISKLEFKLPQNNESSGSILPISYWEEIPLFIQSSNAKVKKILEVLVTALFVI